MKIEAGKRYVTLGGYVTNELVEDLRNTVWPYYESSKEDANFVVQWGAEGNPNCETSALHKQDSVNRYRIVAEYTEKYITEFTSFLHNLGIPVSGLTDKAKEVLREWFNVDYLSDEDADFLYVAKQLPKSVLNDFIIKHKVEILNDFTSDDDLCYIFEITMPFKLTRIIRHQQSDIVDVGSFKAHICVDGEESFVCEFKKNLFTGLEVTFLE